MHETPDNCAEVKFQMFMNFNGFIRGAPHTYSHHNHHYHHPAHAIKSVKRSKAFPVENASNVK